MIGPERQSKVIWRGHVDAVVHRGPRKEWVMSACRLVITDTANKVLAAPYLAIAKVA